MVQCPALAGRDHARRRHRPPARQADANRLPTREHCPCTRSRIGRRKYTGALRRAPPHLRISSCMMRWASRSPTAQAAPRKCCATTPFSTPHTWRSSTPPPSWAPTAPWTPVALSPPLTLAATALGVATIPQAAIAAYAPLLKEHLRHRRRTA